MSERIVVLGWGDDALEVDSMDGAALLQHRLCRASMTLHGGTLATATVLVPHKRLLGRPIENCGESHVAAAMRVVRKMCPRARPLAVPALDPSEAT